MRVEAESSRRGLRFSLPELRHDAERPDRLGHQPVGPLVDRVDPLTLPDPCDGEFSGMGDGTTARGPSHHLVSLDGVELLGALEEPDAQSRGIPVVETKGLRARSEQGLVKRQVERRRERAAADQSHSARVS
jgi:hypothetical protein